MLVAFGEDLGQCLGDLLGGLTQPQEMTHHIEQQRIGAQLDRCAGGLAALKTLLAGLVAAAALGTTVATQLPADGAG